MEHDRSSFSRFLTIFFLYFAELDDYPGGIDAGDVFDPSHVPSPVMARHIRRLSECPGDYSGAEMESFDSGVCDVCSPVTTTSLCDSNTGRGGPSGNINAQMSGSFSARNPISVFKTGSNGSTQSSQRKSKKQFMTLAQVILFFHMITNSKKSTNQPINQSINQHIKSINQSINRTIKQSINQYIESINQSTSQSNNQLTRLIYVFRSFICLFFWVASSVVFFKRKFFDAAIFLPSFFQELSNLVTYFQAVKFQPKTDYHLPGKFHVVSMNEIGARKLSKKLPDAFKSCAKFFHQFFSDDFFYIFHCLKK